MDIRPGPTTRALLIVLAMLLAAGPAAAEPLGLIVPTVEIVPDAVPGQMLLRLELTPESRAAFAAFTEWHVGETVDFRIDGQTVMSVRLVEPILGGMFVVSGMYAKSELEAIARRIEAGKATIEVEAHAP